VGTHGSWRLKVGRILSPESIPCGVLTPEDIAKLVAAIEGLHRGPLLTILTIAIPVIAAIVGVAIGFCLSFLSSKAERKAERKERIRDQVRMKRIAAVSAVSQELRWMAENIGFKGAPDEAARHQMSRKEGPEMFNLTGDIDDEPLSYAYSYFFRELGDSIASFGRSRGSWTEYPNLTDAHIEFFRGQVSRVRSAAQQWINEELDAVEVVRLVVNSSDLMRSRRDIERAK
jgi:hypothetical protein